jgi:ATP-binding cassette subfamily C protein
VAGEQSKSEVRAAAGVLRPIIVSLILLSGVVNVLALTGSFYMLQVYDRILTSRSMPSLVALSLLAATLFLFQGGLEVVRGQILVRLASRLDRKLTPLAHGAVMRLRSIVGAQGNATQPIRDVDSIRTYLSGQGPVAILDMPWMPLYVAFVFALHPILGLITLVGALFLIAVTVLTESLTRSPNEKALAAAKKRWAVVEASDRNAEVLQAMGFGHRFTKRLETANSDHISANERLSDITGGFSTVSRVFRLMLQSGLLGVGAYLTIRGEMTAGAIIACSIAASRALAPIEIAIGNWRGLAAARKARDRLDAVFEQLPRSIQPLTLPPPVSSLKVENISVAVPGTKNLTLRGVSFELAAGTVLAVVGPSAAGKSTLARALTGVWPLERGVIRLDGAPLSSWSSTDLGQQVGYLPQDIQLFDGTITENISRFQESPDSQRVIAASMTADVHEMVLRLPNGYESRVGEGGSQLSAGQRQRIALARALYCDPFVLVLDEPNSNLDADGEKALVAAIAKVKARGGIVIVVAHRPSVLSAADKVAAISGGQLAAFGPRDDVLRKILRQPVSTAPPAALAVEA